MNVRLHLLCALMLLWGCGGVTGSPGSGDDGLNPLDSGSASAVSEDDVFQAEEAILSGCQLDGPTWVGYFDHGDMITFQGVDFGSGVAGMHLLLAVPVATAGQHIDIRLDAAQGGPTIASIQVAATGSWRDFVWQSVTFDRVSGVHDVTLVGRGAADIANVDAVRFIPAPPVPIVLDLQAERGVLDGCQIDLPAWVGYFDHGDSIYFPDVYFPGGLDTFSLLVAVPPATANQRIEARIDAYDGPVVASVTIASTGSWHDFVWQSVALQRPVSELHDLYIVGVGDKDIANIDAIDFIGGGTPNPPPPVEPGRLLTTQGILDDMQQASQARPSGPPYEAALDAVRPPNGVTRTMTWAMIQHVEGGSPSRNTRVEARGMELWVLQRSTGRWVLLSASNLVEGNNAAGVENCAGYGGSQCRADCVRGSDGITWDCDRLSSWPETESSVSTGIEPNMYYQPWMQSFVDRNDIAGMFATMQVRLIGSDTAAARYVAAVGVDWYAGYAWSGAVGVSRRKLVTPQWQSVSFLTVQGTFWENGQGPYALPESQVRANSPADY